MVSSVFDSRCCYNKWNDSLDGRLCFFADDIDTLKSIVDAGDKTVYQRYARQDTSYSSLLTPFLACYEPNSTACSVSYKLCYYDPLYEVKVGHRSGVAVLRRVRDCPEMDWVVDSSPLWDSFHYEYRLATSEDVRSSVFNFTLSNDAPIYLYEDLFDDSFVFRCWDDLLKGRLVYVGDSLESLKKGFLIDKPTVIVPSGNFNFPFSVDGFNGSTYNFRYVYYDPLLDFKRALVDGKVVEVFKEEGWSEVHSNEDFNLQPSCYRIRKESPTSSDVSNRELAYGLSQGNGEYCLDNDEVSYLYSYPKNTSDNPIPTRLMVRSWDSVEWVRPTREYLGLDTE